ncbi:transport protein Trs120 or TRAPPC9 TRAPP II complex subunit-domain-containing protein [Xylaria sp. CBS 124048]|nr:transport protein Trs120 or TRAPPC9 TRAPP II complex subunit-domain-containing protein [Xylaria sp. CBS 124048]
MSEEKPAEPSSSTGSTRHSHAVPASSFPTHNSPRTWFLTSALSPLAVRLIRQLLVHGDYVVACLPPHELEHESRSADFRELVSECKSNRKDREGWKDRLKSVRCDGRTMSQCGAAMAEAKLVFGRVDILLCCTSEVVVGTVEELSTSLATQNLVREQFQTIFFSQVNFIKAALPMMRAEHTGHVMVLTSIGGHIGTPGMPIHTAATWALEGFCDSLAYEVAPFNIKVTIVQPHKEIQTLTNKIIFSPSLTYYDSGNSPAPSVRDILTNVLNSNPETAIEPSDTEILYRYPVLPGPSIDRLVAETVHALTAIGGHENPPARHIVGFEGAEAVKEKLKTVTEELEDFVEASVAVDIFESALKDEAREGKAQAAEREAETEALYSNPGTNVKMSLDSLLPIAPARVRALVLPVGQIKRERFQSFVKRLHAEHVVQLRDITADGRPNRNMFSPLAFPDGAIFYNLITYIPPPSHLALSPFELFREPLAIIAVVDGKELESVAFSKRQSVNGSAPTLAERNIRILYQELENLRDTYTRALTHHVLIFDYNPPSENMIPLPEGFKAIPSPEQCKRTTMKTVMCDISSIMLAEMNTLAKVFEGMTPIESPGQAPMRPGFHHPSPWTPDDLNPHGRRNSQFATSTMTRSSSLSGAVDMREARMSMPPIKSLPFGSNNSSPSVRPTTPARSGLSGPPTTFDDIASVNGSNVDIDGHGKKNGSRANSSEENSKSTSQERIAVQGFGPGGPNEKWRHRGKCRATVILGSLYLQAGRWSDALKELIDGATAAKAINDHLWHGKALELVFISLILLAWAGHEFQLPTVCLSPHEKASINSTKPQDFTTTDPTQPKYLQDLQIILPDLLDRIIGLYTRISGEQLPPFPLSETIIRFSNALTALHLCEGRLNKQALDIMILGKAPAKRIESPYRPTNTPSRIHINNFVFRAFPSSPTEVLTTMDRSIILTGIAAVLGTLGYHRKKVLVLKELIPILTGGLIEARTRGAAEVGIHPAASLAGLNAINGHAKGAGALDLNEGDIEHGIDAFLGLICETYGVVGFEGSGSEPGASASSDLVKSSVSRITSQSSMRHFGFPGAKLNILRTFINFSEALPDFNGVLKFSSDLLRTAGSGVAPGPRRENVAPVISRDEQVRLFTNISKTYGLSQKMGLGHLSAEYWDEFLIRGITLDPLPTTRSPTAHSKNVLPGITTARTSQDVNPFIYNPFVRATDKSTVTQTLVADEAATFKIVIQNPFEIDLQIDSMKLCTEGAPFESSTISTIIGPYRTKVLKIQGTPRGAGSLTVVGGIIQVHGCRERTFSIFSQPWTPDLEMKVKGPPLKPDRINLSVINSLPQSSIMILEGEVRTFSVTLQNISSTTPGPMHTAMANRDASLAELHEFEWILAKKQAIRLRKIDDSKRYIAAGSTATFDGTIQIDYAHLGMPQSEVENEFFTRQVCLDLTVTVNASIELTKVDVLPIQEDVPKAVWHRTGSSEQTGSVSSDDYSLLLMDLRNAWPNDMQVSLTAGKDIAIEEHILPGNTNRVVVPVSRIYIEDPHASIPALNPSRQRQFVVSTSKITPEVERANREAFWYREKMLESISGTWKTLSGPSIEGAIRLRGITLTPRMVDAIKVDEIGIDISMADPKAEGKVEEDNSIFVDEFVQITVEITNRMEQPMYPTLRLMPSLRNRPVPVALDFTRKFAWNGALQQALPLLPAKSTTEVRIGATALCRGEFEICASIEETQLWKAPAERSQVREDDGQEGVKRRERSDTQTLMDAVLGAKERRTWHCRRPCIVAVRDRP